LPLLRILQSLEDVLMKKLINLFIIALVASLSGCAAIQKQNRIIEQMNNLVFNAPADSVYNTAVSVMNSMFIQISTTGKNEGASAWQTSNVSLGSSTYQEKIRFTVKVTAASQGTSSLRIQRERKSNHMGSWKTTAARNQVHEYNVLQKIDPARASEIDRNASTQ
jgi:hypothetical protein